MKTHIIGVCHRTLNSFHISSDLKEIPKYKVQENQRIIQQYQYLDEQPLVDHQ